MAAKHTFVITELRSDSDPQHADDGERFEWTADSSPVAPFDGTRGGGARACPIKPWTIGGEQRTVRTDYPGAQLPSEQVLGPSRKPFTLKGRWDDRYNGSGYALAERKRFEDMCKRGNLCRFAYGPLVLEGIVKEWDFDVQRLWDIDYTFTVSVHQAPDELQSSRSPETPTDPTKALDDFDIAIQAMLDADRGAPRSLVAGTLADDITEALVEATTARQRLADTIDTRDQASPERPVDAFTSIATQFRAGRAASYEILLLTSGVRADLDLATLTPIGVLDFEDWIRSLRWAARISMNRGRAGDLAATERAEPNAVRLYRPRRGESLYSISRKFYGTPHAWRLIYDRNALATFELLGTETLIIPERGA
jgi:nucleoid-associated protein YgaU